MAKRKRPVYNDQFRASAVAMLQGNGYPDNKFALEQTAKYLGLPGRTLRRWADGSQNPPPDQLVIQEKLGLRDVYESVARKYLTQALHDDVVEQTEGKDAVMAAAIATDKMRLLDGLPTEIIAIVPQLIDALQKAGLDPVETFNRMIQKAHERIAD